MPTDADRLKAKQRWYLKQQGRGGMVDAAPMQARIRKLHDVHQISFQRISDKTKVDLANIKWHYHGRAFRYPDRPLTTCQWRIHNAVMTTPFGPADVRQQVRSTGTQRRLRAMIAVGFPQAWLGEHTGRTTSHLNNFIVKNRIEVNAEYATVVEQLYRKYCETDPLDVGVPPRSKTYAQKVAAKHNYAPPECWDEDTIDDPNAVPEYTGACGTEEGYRIHVRETLRGQRLPLCQPCRDAVETRPATPRPPVFLRERFAQLLEEKGISARKLAEVGYGDVGKREMLYRWRSGTRSPKTLGDVERLAVAMGVDIEELVDREAMQREASKPVVGHGQFNPYVLGMVLDLSGLSYNKACELPGANYSTGALSKWVSGGMKPSEPEKLQPIADYFGIDVKEFYS